MYVTVCCRETVRVKPEAKISSCRAKPRTHTKPGALGGKSCGQVFLGSINEEVLSSECSICWLVPTSLGKYISQVQLSTFLLSPPPPVEVSLSGNGPLLVIHIKGRSPVRFLHGLKKRE
jgi:hypothetical protein